MFRNLKQVQLPLSSTFEMNCKFLRELSTISITSDPVLFYIDVAMSVRVDRCT